MKSIFRKRSSSRIAALLLAGSVTAAANPWQKLASLPAPNGGLACGDAAGGIVFLGGTNWEAGATKNWLKTVYQLDPATLRWSSVASLDQPFAYGMDATTGGALVVVGGSTGRAPFPGVIRVENGKLSSLPTGGIGVPAVLSAGGLIGDEIVFVGGTDDAANIQGFGRNTYAWNVRTGGLRTLPPYPGPGFGTAASAVVGGELLVFGGTRWDPATQGVADLAEAYAFSPSRNAWRRLKSFPYALRGHAAVALDDRHVYLGGGYVNGEFTDKAFIYDVAEDRYTPAPPLPYRAGAHLVRSGDFVYCLGGEDRPKHRSDGAYRAKVAELIP